MKTFRQYMETVDEFGYNIEPSGIVNSPYYNPNTIDKMAVMSPQNLVDFILPRMQSLKIRPEGMPKSWWVNEFGTTVFKLLHDIKKVLVEKNGLFYINPAFLIT